MATDVYGPPNPSQLQQKASDVDLMPVRETLNKQFGIDDKRIGYNPQSGYVTIDNQNVLRPPVNRAGSTYAGQDVFNSAAGQINTLNNAYNLQQQVLNPQQQANPYDNRVEQVLQQLSAPQQRVNPIDAQLQAFMSQLMQRTQNPTVIDRNAAYQSPQYAAYQAQAQKQAQGATRQAQEALGASRLGRSSVLADRAQGIQNDANQFLETQAVPQIIAQLQAQEEAETQKLYNLINALGQQQSVYDTRMSQEDARLYNFMNALTQQQGIHDTRGNQQYDRAAQVLDFLTGQQNRAQDLEIQQEQTQYNREQDQITNDRNRRADELNEIQITAQLTGYLPDGTPTNAQQQQQLMNLWRVADETGTIPPELAQLYGLPENTPTLQAKQIAANIAISQQNANTSAFQASTSARSADNAERRLNFDIEQASRPKETAQTTKIDAKMSADNYDLILEDLQSANVSKDRARQLVEANRDFLSDSDYKKLRDYINESF